MATVALPLKLFDMAWQVSVVNAIINNSTIPLEGIVLAHLAAYLDPSKPRFEEFCKKLRSWALLATLGFLLLIPLQSYNFAKGISNYKQSAANYESTITKNFENIRNAVKTSGSFEELEKQLSELKGPPLSAASRSIPLPILRQSLLAAIQQAEANAKATSTVAGPDQIWAFAKDMLRSILTACAFAVAFAAAAKRSIWQESLLVGFNRSLGSLLKSKPASIAKAVEAYKAQQKSKNEANLTKRRLSEYASQRRILEKQQEKERRLREKNLARLRAKEGRNKNR